MLKQTSSVLNIVTRRSSDLFAWIFRAIAALPVFLVIITLIWNWQPVVSLVSQIFTRPTDVFKTLAYGLPMIGWALYGTALWIGATIIGRLHNHKAAWESSLTISGGLLVVGSLFQLLWTSHTLHMWMYYSGPLPAPANKNIQALLLLIGLIGILMAAASLRIHRLKSELDEIV
ncbi:MAG: hypothetical protein NVV72_04945 [Asticcacaulis sp.]|nr:hypothetical protein [Asticcacaulis sp.]